MSKFYRSNLVLLRLHATRGGLSGTARLSKERKGVSFRTLILLGSGQQFIDHIFANTITWIQF